MLDWARLPDPAATLAGIPVEDVWGIADRWRQRLRALGLADALAVRAAEPRWLRQQGGVVLERLGWELRGCACLPLAVMAPPRQQLQVSRTFGAAVTAWPELRAALTRFASRAGEKLRAQGLAAPALTVFIQTDPFDTARPFYTNAVTRPFVAPTQDSAALIAQALAGAARLCRRGDAYRRAGVLLPDLAPVGQAPADLFAAPDAEDRATRRMAALDGINLRFGRATLRYGGELIGLTGG